MHLQVYNFIISSVHYSNGVRLTRYLLGIGRATAIALSKTDWNVVLIARRLDQLRETENLCQGRGKLVLSGDVADEEFIVRSFQQAVSTFGELGRQLATSQLAVKLPFTGRVDLVFNVSDSPKWYVSGRSHRQYRMPALLLRQPLSRTCH